jgi:(p)ppGpp synthase/HD superfamily hydrolase
MTPDEIRKGFGDEVARCVDGVTKLSKLDIFNAEDRQAESFRKVLPAMVDDIRVIIVKLARIGLNPLSQKPTARLAPGAEASREHL